MNKGASISKYYKSFSGTDTIAFLMFPGASPIVIGQLTTFSYSMFRNKVPVINIGRTNINGITRGSRIYAGTMVFTLINKHWVRELQDQISYLESYPTLKTDELPLFDIMIVSSNEYGSSCSMFVYGIDFTDESQTISIEDLFTENVFKFVAREVSVFDENVITAQKSIKKYYYMPTTNTLRNYYTDEQARQTDKVTKQNNIRPLNRTLYLVTNSTPIIGDDVAGVQQLLNMALEREVPITYKFDRMTDEATRDFQRTVGLEVNGIVDNGVYTRLLEYTKEGTKGQYVQVINKAGAFIYRDPDTSSSITKILPYLASTEVFEKINNKKTEVFYRTKDGYISLYDVYNRYTNSNSVEFKQLKYGDRDPQVTVLQGALSDLYNNFKGYESGEFDIITENYVKKFQRDKDLIETGIVDNYTWNLLTYETELLNRYYNDNHTIIEMSKEPGIYNIKNMDYLDIFNTTITNNSVQQVKYSTIAVYNNKQTKTKTKISTFDGTEVFNFSDFDDLFKDDIEYLNPTDVYYIIYIYNNVAYKWHFRIKE